MYTAATLATLAATGLTLIATPLKSQTITNGFTFAVASGSGAPATGTHYHSNTGGAFGNPAGKAEVGRYSGETVRGLSEYNLAGLTASASAFVTFDVFKAGGLFNGVNDTPFTGPINIYAYQGNNAENISDYQAVPFTTIGSFSVGPTVQVGDIFSFNIAGAFNTAIAGSFSSLGIRLEASPTLAASQAWTFENFRLTSNNQTTGSGAVPEPATWTMMLIGFGAIGATMRRRGRQPATSVKFI